MHNWLLLVIVATFIYHSQQYHHFSLNFITQYERYLNNKQQFGIIHYNT